MRRRSIRSEVRYRNFQVLKSSLGLIQSVEEKVRELQLQKGIVRIVCLGTLVRCVCGLKLASYRQSSRHECATDSRVISAITSTSKVTCYAHYIRRLLKLTRSHMLVIMLIGWVVTNCVQWAPQYWNG